MTDIRATLNKIAPAVEQLARHQQQADADGVMVTVSRQAVDEVVNSINEIAISLPAAPGEPCAVKPLEWTGRNADGSIHIAYDGPVQYWAWELAGYGYWSWGALAGREVIGGLDAAKAAAQADYEQRIRSALVTTPQPAAGWDIPVQITPEIACILEDCSGPENQTPGAHWAEAAGKMVKQNIRDLFCGQHAPSEARLQIKTLLDETGSRDLEDLKDMAMVGHATMAAIAVVIESDGPLKDWSPAQCPSEIITDMFNMLGDIASAEARLREASATVENLIRRDPACFNLSDELQSVRAALREALTAPGRSEAKESEGGVPPFGGYGSAEAAVAAADGSAQTCHETFKALRKIIDVAYDALAMTWDQSGMPGPSDPTAAERREIVARPRVNDNDSGEITVTLEGKELRGWSYTNDQERRTKMLCAREFVEGFCTGREA